VLKLSFNNQKFTISRLSQKIIDLIQSEFKICSKICSMCINNEMKTFRAKFKGVLGVSQIKISYSLFKQFGNR